MRNNACGHSTILTALSMVIELTPAGLSERRMNIPWTVDPAPQGSLEFEPPKSKPGDYIVMRAEMDCIIAFSACPQVWPASLRRP